MSESYFIECCVCYYICEKYTHIPTQTKCKHPVCVDCFKKIIPNNNKKLCPLCRVEIRNLDIEISLAVNYIKNFKKSQIDLSSLLNQYDDIIFYNSFITLVTYKKVLFTPTQIKKESKFKYMNKIIPKNTLKLRLHNKFLSR